MNLYIEVKRPDGVVKTRLNLTQLDEKGRGYVEDDLKLYNKDCEVYRVESIQELETGITLDAAR